VVVAVLDIKMSALENQIQPLLKLWTRSLHHHYTRKTLLMASPQYEHKRQRI